MKSQKGFGAAELVLVFVILGLVGFVGLIVWNNGRKENPSATQQNMPQTNQDKTDNTPQAKVLSLDAGKVSFKLQSDWTYEKGPDNCPGNAIPADGIKCIEGAIITPGDEAKYPADFGNGNERFRFSVGLLTNPRSNDAQTWLEEDFSEGSETDLTVSSHESINGLNTYYRRVNRPEYTDVYYTFTNDDKAVHLYARTYYSAWPGDFRKIEPKIKEMVSSIKF